MDVSTPTIAQQVAEHLSPYLGPFNAGVAVKTFAQRALKQAADTVTLEQLPALLEALRPMLHTMVGRVSADALLTDIQRRVR
jgi:hypothetical protein